MSAIPIVHVIDVDVPSRAAVVSQLRAHGYHAAPYSSAEQFLDVDAQPPGCILTETTLPRLNGLELLDQVAGRPRPLPLIFITAHGNIPISVRAIKNGAADFLTKPVSGSALIMAVRRAIAQSSALSPSACSDFEHSALLSQLTRRERNILDMLAHGLLNKQVAFELGLSERTVKAHRASIMAKLQLTSFAELVLLAMKFGMAPQARLCTRPSAPQQPPLHHAATLRSPGFQASAAGAPKFAPI